MYNTGFREKLNVARYSKFLFSLAAIALFTIFDSLPATAQGNLLITPRRVVFEGSKRVAELNLANTGKDTAKYNVSIIQYRMTENGAFEEITEPDPGQLFADKFIRFYPRTVTLAPNESQSVKMQVVNSDKMTPGEYRSHVYFRAVPKQSALGEANNQADTAAVSVQLIPIFGITIPVIIRSGQLDMNVSITDLKLSPATDSTKILDLTFLRSGSMSVYGDIKIVHISSSGKQTPVSTVNGIAVYTPNTKRVFKVEINTKNLPVDLNSGTLRISLLSQSETRPEKYCEADLKLQ